MEPHSFSSLKDILKPSSPNKSVLMRSILSPSPSGTTHTKSSPKPCDHHISHDRFGGLSLDQQSDNDDDDDSSSLNSLNNTPQPLSPSLSSSSSCLFDLSLGNEEKIVDVKKETKVMMNPSSSGKNVVFGKSTKKEGLFPPPISCLKLFKTGKPFVYLNYNEEDNSYVREEIRIPASMFYASRENGRLKLYCAHSDEDESPDSEGEEEEETEKKEEKH